MLTYYAKVAIEGFAEVFLDGVVGREYRLSSCYGGYVFTVKKVIFDGDCTLLISGWDRPITAVVAGSVEAVSETIKDWLQDALDEPDYDGFYIYSVLDSSRIM